MHCHLILVLVSTVCWYLLGPIMLAGIILRLVGNPGALSINTSLIGKYQMLNVGIEALA